RLASPQARHLYATIRVRSPPFANVLLFQSFRRTEKSAIIRDDPQAAALIQCLWWGGLVGRLWLVGSCTSSPLAKRKHLEDLGVTAMEAVSISRSNWASIRGERGCSCIASAVVAGEERSALVRQRVPIGQGSPWRKRAP